MRYELFVRETRKGMKDFALDINTVTKDTLADIWDFMENEHAYAEEYPEIYATIPEKAYSAAKRQEHAYRLFLSHTHLFYMVL